MCAQPLTSPISANEYWDTYHSVKQWKPHQTDLQRQLAVDAFEKQHLKVKWLVKIWDVESGVFKTIIARAAKPGFFGNKYDLFVHIRCESSQNEKLPAVMKESLWFVTGKPKISNESFVNSEGYRDSEDELFLYEAVIEEA